MLCVHAVTIATGVMVCHESQDSHKKSFTRPPAQTEDGRFESSLFFLIIPILNIRFVCRAILYLSDVYYTTSVIAALPDVLCS